MARAVMHRVHAEICMAALAVEQVGGGEEEEEMQKDSALEEGGQNVSLSGTKV